jgi:hypothetical protein
MDSIIPYASRNNKAYTKIIPTLLEIISSPDAPKQSLDQYFSLYNSATLEQQYLKNILKFVPITESPTLISNDIEGVSPIINGILKKIHTDLAGEERDVLQNRLIKDLSEVAYNPAIKTILEIGQCADICIYKKGGGTLGAYTKAFSKDKLIISICEAAGYISETENINVATGLVHESTHLSLDYVFKNVANPFKKTDKTAEKWWTNFVGHIISELKLDASKEAEAELDKLMPFVSNGYNELALAFYPEDQYIKELPAFWMQEIATRMLNPNIERQSIILQHSHEFDIMDFIIKAIEHKDDPAMQDSDIVGEVSLGDIECEFNGLNLLS